MGKVLPSGHFDLPFSQMISESSCCTYSYHGGEKGVAKISW